MKFNDELVIIEKAVTAHNLTAIISLFSGGHDSLLSAYVTSFHPLFRGVIYIDTGINLKETQEYVESVCTKYNWELFVYKASDYKLKNGEPRPQIYDNFVKKYGFPGPSQHKIMYNRLKGYPLQQAKRELENKYGGKIGFTTGIRLAESDRRARNYGQAADNGGFDKHKGAVWINPILYVDNDQKDNLIKDLQLPKNPLYEIFCKSTDCLCGCYRGEADYIALEIHFPDVAQRLKDLHDGVKDEFPWHWYEKPPEAFQEQKRLEKQGQIPLDFSLCYRCESMKD